MKVSLKKRISKHDYSYLEWDHHINRVFPLQDRINDTGEYYLIKSNVAYANLASLINLKVFEFFRYCPECIDELRGLPPFYDCEGLEDMDIGELLEAIGNLDDISSDYTRFQVIADACWILFRVIIDSNFTHPFLRSSFGHFTSGVWEKTHDEHSCSNGNKDVLRLNMNDYLRELINKHYDEFLRDDPRLKEAAFRLFYNYVIRNAIILRKNDF